MIGISMIMQTVKINLRNGLKCYHFMIKKVEPLLFQPLQLTLLRNNLNHQHGLPN